MNKVSSFRNGVNSKTTTKQSAPNLFYIFKINSSSKKSPYYMSVSCNSAIYFIYTVLSFTVTQYLERFVRTGPSGYGAYCTERLHRIKENGERKELPCWHEIQVEMELDFCLIVLIPF